MAYQRLRANFFLPIGVAIILLLLAGFATTPPQNRLDNVPMYGQPEIPRTDFFRKADEDFISLATEQIGSGEKASLVFAAEADLYMAEGNLDFAMRRYNQSWLLNPRSFRPYWGFGLVMRQRGRLDESLKHFEMAKQLIDDNDKKPALLADAGAAYVSMASSLPDSLIEERKRLFALGDDHFAHSVVLDPHDAFVYRVWALSLFSQGNYAGAWEKVKQARIRNSPPFPAEFIHALEHQLPEPK